MPPNMLHVQFDKKKKKERKMTIIKIRMKSHEGLMCQYMGLVFGTIYIKLDLSCSLMKQLGMVEK
jgi:hypothetical protein